MKKSLSIPDTRRMRYGRALTDKDYARLAKSWIPRELADSALLRRVDSAEGGQMVGRNDFRDYSGIIFPYFWPGEDYARDPRLRRDNPELEQKADGTRRERDKYLSPPGRGNRVYFPPGTEPEWLTDVSLPVIITEGEKKCLALSRLALDGIEEVAERPRWLVCAVSGVWNFRGKIGRTPGPDGGWRDVKGVIPDLTRITWPGRLAVIVYDANALTNGSVAAARRELVNQLTELGANVRLIDLPEVAGVNGIDDLLAAWGPERVLELFDQAKPAAVAGKDKSGSQAKVLIELAADVQLFTTRESEGYARIVVDDHLEVWMLRSKGFKRWLRQKFYQVTNKPPAAQALEDAIGVLEAKAQFKAPEAPLFLRIAGSEDRIYIDLADSKWRVVEITAKGWRVMSDPPVLFRRTAGMRPLPEPIEGGSINTLRRFLNLGDERNWTLGTAWLVAACRPSGPFPILTLVGEQGSAKSTFAKLLRRIIDPSAAPVRTPPRDERDLMIAASNAWILNYDNLSGVPPWLSDALCRLATGGGFTTRRLYTDTEEVFFDAMRPVILNGIDHLADRADLADRALILNLPPIEDKDRVEEARLYAEFEQALPEILGGLFTVLGAALARLPTIKLDQKPRMADFAVWATAAEEALGFQLGGFISAYEGNRANMIEETLEADPVGVGVLAILDELMGQGQTEQWDGNCGELLERLGRVVDDGTKKSRVWPNTPRALSSRLRRLAPFLRASGVQIKFHAKGAKGRRGMTIVRTARI